MSASNAQPSPALHVNGLALARGGRRLVSGIDLLLAPGNVVFLRGPNGAGKTSLLLALAGVLRPESGTIRMVGGDDGEPAERRVHLLLPQSGMKARLTVRENLDFWRALNGPTGLASEAALERVGLGGLGAIEAGHLSTGQLKRLGLARLLVSHRAIWLLDEPQSALDAEGEALVGALIGAHVAAGGAAVVTTHHDIAITPPAAVLTLTLGATR